MKQILLFFLFLTPFLSYAQGFTKAEYEALVSYMGDDHIEINKYLRRETKNIDFNLEEEIALISQALIKVNKYSRETYRGTCLPVLMIVDGVNGADISDFAKYFLGHDSIQYEEEEVLFNHGTTFLVENISKENLERTGEIFVIKLKEL